MEQSVRGNKRPNPPARRTSTLYISGLDVSVTDRDLKEECAKFGNIKRGSYNLEVTSDRLTSENA